jgi:hypothetical protein
MCWDVLACVLSVTHTHINIIIIINNINNSSRTSITAQGHQQQIQAINNNNGLKQQH